MGRRHVGEDVVIAGFDERIEAAEREGGADSAVETEICVGRGAAHIWLVPVDSRATDEIWSHSDSGECIHDVRVG